MTKIVKMSFGSSQLVQRIHLSGQQFRLSTNFRIGLSFTKISVWNSPLSTTFRIGLQIGHASRSTMFPCWNHSANFQQLRNITFLSLCLYCKQQAQILVQYFVYEQTSCEDQMFASFLSQFPTPKLTLYKFFLYREQIF